MRARPSLRIRASRQVKRLPELQVVRFCAFCPSANTDGAASGAMAVLSCSRILPSSLPSSGADQILQSLHHHLGAAVRRRSHSVRRPSDPLPPPPSSIRLTGLTHTHSFSPSFPRRLSWQKMVICGLATERAGGAACQAGDGAAQRSGGRARAEGRSGSIKKTEIIKIMILLSLVRIAMRCKPSRAGPVRAAQGRVILTRAHAAIAAQSFFKIVRSNKFFVLKLSTANHAATPHFLLLPGRVMRPCC